MAAEKIKITDLAHPVLSEIQQQALAHAAAHPVTLTAEAVMAAASAATGLGDWGAMDFLPRLEQWMRACEADTGLSAVGRGSLFALALRYASARLQLEDLIRRHPEIEQVELEAPLVIAGLAARGDTTVNRVYHLDRGFERLEEKLSACGAEVRRIRDAEDES